MPCRRLVRQSNKSCVGWRVPMEPMSTRCKRISTGRRRRFCCSAGTTPKKNRAQAQVLLQRWDDALASLDVVIGLSPEHVQAHQVRLSVLERLNRR